MAPMALSPNCGSWKNWPQPSNASCNCACRNHNDHHNEYKVDDHKVDEHRVGNSRVSNHKVDNHRVGNRRVAGHKVLGHKADNHTPSNRGNLAREDSGEESLYSLRRIGAEPDEG